MNKIKKNYGLLLIVAVLFLMLISTLSLIAQTNGVPVDTTPPAPAAKPNLWLMIITLALPIVFAAVKFFIPKFPKWLIPILCPVIGAAADWLGTGTLGQGTAWGALAGSAAVGFREIVDQMKKLGTDATPPTK